MAPLISTGCRGPGTEEVLYCRKAFIHFLPLCLPPHTPTCSGTQVGQVFSKQLLAALCHLAFHTESLYLYLKIQFRQSPSSILNTIFFCTLFCLITQMGCRPCHRFACIISNSVPPSLNPAITTPPLLLFFKENFSKSLFEPN